MPSKKLPSGTIVNISTPIIEDGNFSWGEATKNLSRMPSNKSIENNIIQTAFRLQSIRTYLGNEPIYITSWLRDNKSNILAGGARNSRHLYGDAVDIRSNVLSNLMLYRKLNHIVKDGGLARYSTHVHLDFRGYRARW